MRFLTLELDGRSTLDRAQQRLYGVVLGQMAMAHAGAGAPQATRPASSPARRPAMRRWLQSTVERLRRTR